MTVSLTLETLFTNILETKFLKNIYHSVTLQPKLQNGGFSPAAQVAGRYNYVGPDDTKGFTGYVRQIGAMEAGQKEFIGSTCGSNVRYKMRIPFRAVFFNDKEKRNFEEITIGLTKAVIKTPRVDLTRINPIREDVLKTEVPSGQFSFKTSTYYVSIDFFIILFLQTDNCEQVLTCAELLNPFCTPG